jgi:hypothetical protein
MVNFTPKQTSKARNVPFFEDASREDGWAGHTTGKSMAKLKAEISEAVTRLGGIVTRFKEGYFEVGGRSRSGFQVEYSISDDDGNLAPGRIDIAALPVRRSINEEKSLRMALYMLRNAFEGMWFMQQLSPGYSALMPFLLADGQNTVSQLWSERTALGLLLPPPSSDFVEGEVVK